MYKRQAHLNTVLSCDHALIEQLMERFVKIDHADIIQELCIESGVQKMQYCMLHTADIHIYRQIFVCFLSGNQFFILSLIHIWNSDTTHSF